MNMDRQTTVSVIENLLKHGRFNTVTRNAMENAVRLLNEQASEIAFLKEMQRRTIKGIDDQTIGEQVGEMLGIV